MNNTKISEYHQKFNKTSVVQKEECKENICGKLSTDNHITGNKCQIWKIGSNESVESNHLLFSGYNSAYSSTYIKKVLKTLPRNFYVLCIGYEEGDVQIGLTETSKFGESAREAAVRGIYEETASTLIDNCKYINNVLVVSCEQLTHARGKIENKQKDNKKQQKGIAVIYGNEQDINKCAERISASMTQRKGHDGIDFYVGIPISSAIDAIDIAHENKRKGKSREIFKMYISS